MRVLVAEDDDNLRSVLVRGLEKAGYVVDSVSNGSDALAYLRAYEYGVAILDWRIPVLNGIEVLRAIRLGGSGVPVLMLTAKDLTADRVLGLDEGADDYMVKPFDFPELLARLRALQRRPSESLRPVMSVGDLVYDPASRTVNVGQADIALTHTELGILEVIQVSCSRHSARDRRTGLAGRSRRSRLQHDRRPRRASTVETFRCTCED